jgi:hypothetical protein
MGVGGQRHAPAALPPGVTRYPSYRRRLGGPQGQTGRVRKISPSRWLDPLTVQPVASFCTDWSIAVSVEPEGPILFGTGTYAFLTLRIPFHTFTSCLFTIHFNVILSSMPRFPKRVLSFTLFPRHPCVQFCHLHAFHMVSPAHPLVICLSSICLEFQVMKFHLMLFYFTPCFLPSPGCISLSCLCS